MSDKNRIVLAYSGGLDTSVAIPYLKDRTGKDVVANSIRTHMFPLTPVPPRHVEGWLVTAADKISATTETFSPDRFAKPHGKGR